MVLVTGASGGLGQRLLPLLRGAGWRIRCLVHRRPVTGADEEAQGDLAEPRTLEPALARTDAVLHLAATTHARSEREYLAINTEGTGNLLAAAEAAGVRRFVHVSTRAIDPSGGAYSASKAAAERLVRISRVEHVIVRLPEVFGTGGREGVDQIIAAAVAGRPVVLVGKGSDDVCPLHVDDALPPLVCSLSAEAAAGHTLTLAGECMTLRQFAERCVERYGSRSRIVGIPTAAVALASRISAVLPLPLYPDQLTRLRSTKPPASPEAAELLDFHPTPLDQRLAAPAP